eukprot:TRINITY_DN80178_c0_g1_i2.p1 TRINITY_DN80178_c0_g1~~TRINITY_DN80178_c0_g1_i2.p1  ORF type:complete len:218 (+),score=19.28 TRINITY_DN80178_c0_g1_i2:51-704(+)
MSTGLSCIHCGGPARQRPGLLAVDCTRCRALFCAGCGELWTRYHNCESHALLATNDKFQARVEQYSSSYVNVVQPLPHFKICPGCACPLEKDDPDACDHMKCYNCRKEFCWTCMADRDVIKAHGNHYHDPSCRFYFEFDGIDEYKRDCWKCRKYGFCCPRPDQKRPPDLRSFGVPLGGHVARAQPSTNRSLDIDGSIRPPPRCDAGGVMNWIQSRFS